MRPIRLIANGPQGIVATDAAAIFVGAVIDERQVLDSRGTVLDPDICKKGDWIDLPIPCMDFVGKPIERLYYPAFDHQRRGRLIHLNRMAVLANMMLRTIQAFQEGTAAETAVQKMALAYQLGAIRQLGGKRGVVNANLIASRVSRSARGVLLVNGDRHPSIVGIPSQIMRKLKMENGDLVFVGREPTIWHGSMEVLRAQTNNRYAIELHPLVFKQLGADCDGDTVYVYAVPKDSVCQDEASEQVLGFTKDFAKWPSYMRLQNPSDVVDWTIVKEDSEERAQVTGFSVTPREILEQGDRLKRLCTTMGKDVSEECRTIAKGIDEATLRKYVKDQNNALLHMKLWMGPIGAVSNRLRVFAGTDKQLLASASHVSERLQQMLLDTKHYIGKKQGYGPTDVLEILNRRGRFSSVGGSYLEDVVDELAKMGMDREKVWPIMAYLWLVYPITRAFDALYADKVTETTKKPSHAAFRLKRLRAQISSEFYVGRQMKECLNRLKKMAAMYRVDVDVNAMLEKYKEYAGGLNEICAADYPLLQLMNESVMADPPEAFRVAQRIFIDGTKDMGGVTRLAMEEALDVQR